MDEADIAGYRRVELVRPGPGGTTEPEPGGPAVLWHAVRIRDGADVAMKHYHPADIIRAQREVDFTRLVDHPHILPVTDFLTDADLVAIVTPWASGGNLARLLAVRGRLTPAETLTVLIPLADALTAAHEHEVIHGDVSAGNVLFDSDGRPLLADLGCAGAATEMGLAVAATPCDVAPEVARGAPASRAADLFALGSVALRCLTGRPAWPADSFADVVVQATAGQWPDPGDVVVSEPLRGRVRRLLDVEPERRGSAARLAVDLRRAGTPEPVRMAGSIGDSGAAGIPATIVRADADADADADAAAAGPSVRQGDRQGPTARERIRRMALRRAAPSGAGGAGEGDVPPATNASGTGAAVAAATAHPAVAAGATSARSSKRWPRHADRRNSTPSAVGAPHRRGRHRAIPVAIGVLASALAIYGAVHVGWWWASWGRSDPAVVAAAPAGTTIPSATRGPSAGAVGPHGEPVPTSRAHETGADPTGENMPTASVPGVHHAPSTATAAVTPPDGPDWRAVVVALDRARSDALRDRNAGGLDAVYTTDAPGRRDDTDRISALIDRGLHVVGARHQVISTGVDGTAGPHDSAAIDGTAATPPKITITVVESLPAYDIRDDAGHRVGSTSAAPRTTLVMTLRYTRDGYRIADIVRL